MFQTFSLIKRESCKPSLSKIQPLRSCKITTESQHVRHFSHQVHRLLFHRFLDFPKISNSLPFTFTQMATVSPHSLFQKDFGLGIFEAFRGGGRREAPVGAGGRVAEEAAGQEEAAVRPQPPLHRGLAEELGVSPDQRGPGGLAGGEARVARPALARHHRFVCEVSKVWTWKP